jgi:hypothetical protein
MYIPIDPQPTNVQGWLAAATEVQQRGGDAHNVVIDVADPLTETEADVEIIKIVDCFLRDHRANTLNGVANTIFLRASSIDMDQMISIRSTAIRSSHI